MRKLCLVGLPVFFRPGELEQLVLGLLVCFISFGACESQHCNDSAKPPTAKPNP